MPELDEIKALMMSMLAEQKEMNTQLVRIDTRQEMLEKRGCSQEVVIRTECVRKHDSVVSDQSKKLSAIHQRIDKIRIWSAIGAGAIALLAGILGVG